jgi:hypothetical protein
MSFLINAILNITNREKTRTVNFSNVVSGLRKLKERRRTDG